jgi:hypothetical protein
LKFGLETWTDFLFSLGCGRELPDGVDRERELTLPGCLAHLPQNYDLRLVRHPC